jgi:hypothetical protein
VGLLRPDEQVLETFADFNDRFSKSRTPKIGAPDPGPQIRDLGVEIVLQHLVDRNPAVAARSSMRSLPSPRSAG